MKFLYLLLIVCFFTSCESKEIGMEKIVFLHHSTGWAIWIGKTNNYVNKLTQKSDVKTFFKHYNKENKTKYIIEERIFPNSIPYGWKNDPFDYYNIWVKNAGEKPHMNEPTLEILTKEFDIIIFKHCYPVSNIKKDIGSPDINSEEKRVENYKLQYIALKNKMHEFPDKKFIVWTPSVQVKNLLTLDEARRTQEFYRWIKDEWDEKGDNIFIWDFYNYETEGGGYFLDKYACGINNSHPNIEFSARIAPLFAQFIIDVAKGDIE
jgi:hypothetical protein